MEHELAIGLRDHGPYVFTNGLFGTSKRGWEGSTFNLCNVGRGMTLPGDQVESLPSPSNCNVEQSPFFSRGVSSTHAHWFKNVRVFHLRGKAEEVVASVCYDDNICFKSLRLVGR